MIYLGEDLATAAAEVFRTPQALICPFFRVAQLSPVNELQLQDITGQGARAIGAMPLLSDSTDYELTNRWARAIYDADTDVAGIRYHSAQGGGLDSMVIWDRAPAMTPVAELPLDGPEMAGRIVLVLTVLRVTVRFIPKISCSRCLEAGTISGADFVTPGLP